jgi:hypothetical protein
MSREIWPCFKVDGFSNFWESVLVGGSMGHTLKSHDYSRATISGSIPNYVPHSWFFSTFSSRWIGNCPKRNEPNLDKGKIK